MQEEHIINQIDKESGEIRIFCITVDKDDYGDVVICDGCNGGEESLGGALLGSYAMCGECCEEYKYYEKADEVFNKTLSFKQNVLDWRQKTYGSSHLASELVSIKEINPKLKE